MHGSFDYRAEQRADRACPPLSSQELAEFGRWAGVILAVLMGLVIGAVAGLVTGVMTGLVPLC
jgi:hypothetical protein